MKVTNTCEWYDKEGNLIEKTVRSDEIVDDGVNCVLFPESGKVFNDTDTLEVKTN